MTNINFKNPQEVTEWLKSLKGDDGATLKNFRPVIKKVGFQVATEGIVTTFPSEAAAAIVAFGGNCGIWVNPESMEYCIDKSHWIRSRDAAIAEGREWNQYSILNWYWFSRGDFEKAFIKL